MQRLHRLFQLSCDLSYHGSTSIHLSGPPPPLFYRRFETTRYQSESLVLELALRVDEFLLRWLNISKDL